MLNWRGTEETIMIGIIPNLGEDLILGTDNPDFSPLLEKACHEDVTSAWWEKAPHGVVEVEERPLKKKLSRKQKREQRKEYHATPTTDTHMSVLRAATVLKSTGSFRQAQREDPTLKKSWQQALQPDERSKRAVRGARGVVDKEEEPADGGDNADEMGATETEEEMLRLKQAVKEDSLGLREPADCTCVETPESTAAREAFCDPSSHAGEAWPSHVRH
ncbi:hypothetical protein NDU88_003279 [Pleurodeles waltl]|uniref:Uncharacterized protein n=1 Tax=Pleurodeles waltl TaxID=8319 RepID=A0AAV7VCX2_PLEWA|nr:hypothetical protein NDU88_003279 [Pleurodeles waltl]